jgi:hypothetical protein
MLKYEKRMQGSGYPCNNPITIIEDCLKLHEIIRELLKAIGTRAKKEVSINGKVFRFEA